MTLQRVYAVWAQTDDFYDNGEWVSLYASREAAEVEAKRLIGVEVAGVGVFIRAQVDEVPLRDATC